MLTALSSEVYKIKVEFDADEALKCEAKDEASKLVKEFEGISTEASKVADDVEDANDRIGKNFDANAEKAKTVGQEISKSGNNIISTFKKATLIILGTAAAISVSANRLNRLQAEATSADTTIENLQTGQAVLRAAGIEGDYGAGVSRLRDLQAQAQQGQLDPETLKLIARLGANTSDFFTQSPEDLLQSIVRSAERAGLSPEQRETARVNVGQLLGPEFKQLLDYNLEQGTTFDELLKEFRESAFTSREAAQQGREFAKEFSRFSTTAESFFNNFSGDLAEVFTPSLEALTDKLIDNRGEISGQLSTLAELLGDIVESLSEAVSTIGLIFDNISEFLGGKGVQEFLAEDAFPAVAGARKSSIDFLSNTFYPAIGDFFSDSPALGIGGFESATTSQVFNFNAPLIQGQTQITPRQAEESFKRGLDNSVLPSTP